MAVASLFAQWAPQLIQNAQGDTTERTETIQQCSDITLSFVNTNTQNATIQQSSGSNGVGNVSVTWFYEDSNPVQRYANLTGSGDAVRLTTNTDTSNVLTEIQGQALECEGAGAATYTPPVS